MPITYRPIPQHYGNPLSFINDWSRAVSGESVEPPRSLGDYERFYTTISANATYDPQALRYNFTDLFANSTEVPQRTLGHELIAPGREELMRFLRLYMRDPLQRGDPVRELTVEFHPNRNLDYSLRLHLDNLSPRHPSEELPPYMMLDNEHSMRNEEGHLTQRMPALDITFYPPRARNSRSVRIILIRAVLDIYASAGVSLVELIALSMAHHHTLNSSSAFSERLREIGGVLRDLEAIPNRVDGLIESCIGIRPSFWMPT